ncbi:MAG: BON domain-containing protein [Silvibacterium sp.]
MLTPYGNKMKLFRTAAVGLLAGCAWFTTTSIAFAQDQGVAQQSQRDDAAIQSDVSAAFNQDSALQGQHITVTATRGIVTLTGTVQTAAQRQQAETDAANVSGVSGIVNNLKATSGGTAAPATGLAAQTAANQLSPQDQSAEQDQGQDQTQQQGQVQQQPQGQAQESVPPPPPDAEQGPYQQPPPPVYGQQPPPYPQQGGYQQGYQQAPPQVPYYPTPSGPVTVPAGTLLRVRLSEPLDTAHLQNGASFQTTAAVDVYQNGVLAIPRGALLTGQVVESKEGGRLGGSAILRLRLTNVNLAGKLFPLNTEVWSSRGPNKAGYTAGNTAGGAVLGALIGGIVGRGAGAAIGAGVGAAGGLAASSASNGPRVYLPTEASVDFHLVNPVTVQPVPWQEAQRLASSAPRPVLVRRPRPVYVTPGPYYGPYPYAYPYPY